MLTARAEGPLSRNLWGIGPARPPDFTTGAYFDGQNRLLGPVFRPLGSGWVQELA